MRECQRRGPISYDDPGSLDAAFQGASAIIHLAGILVESPDSTYEQANVASTRSVVEAAKRTAVQKFVLVSATGADETSSQRLLPHQRAGGSSGACIRPELYDTARSAPAGSWNRRRGGPGAAMRAAAKAKLIGGGRNFQQPLYVDDLARAALAATQPSVANNRTLDLVGPGLAAGAGTRRAGRSLAGPRSADRLDSQKYCFRLVLAIRQRIGRPGFSRDALEVITADTRLDPQPAASELGIHLTGIDEMIKNSLGQGATK